MRGFFAGFAATVLLAACNGGAPNPPVTQSRQAAAVRSAKARLLLDEEFNEPSLDKTLWYTCYPYTYPPHGCSNNPGLELEWYEPQNVSVRGGSLQLTARHQTRHRGYPYTSGMISTGGINKPAFSFLYGYAEARIKLPRGAGMWPAFWLIPSNFTWPPEIDVMEWQGVVPKLDLVTIHWGASSSPQQYGTAVNTGKNLYADYHVYAVDWEPSYVRWYFDGKPVMTFTDRNEIPHQPMFVILNLAIGGWYPGQLDPAPRSFPATMSVDYVRVWNRRPKRGAEPPT